MSSRTSKALISAALGGLSAGIAAPLLWPFVDVLTQQKTIHHGPWLPFLFDLLMGSFVVGLIAAAVGLAFGLVIGFPLLRFGGYIGINRALHIIAAGAFISVAICSGFFAKPLSSWWPLYLFFVVIGGVCSAVAVKLNKL